MLVYFVSKKSNYKDYPGVTWFDVEKNALNHPPMAPAIYHPPCRLFSKLRKFSTAPVDEMYLAHWSMYFVRCYGGIVEHPFDSQLWKIYNINKVHIIDEFGGFFHVIDQYDFGFPTRKRTGLYIVGTLPRLLPASPIRLYISEKKWDRLSPLQRSLTPISLIDYFSVIMKNIKK